MALGAGWYTGVFAYLYIIYFKVEKKTSEDDGACLGVRVRGISILRLLYFKNQRGVEDSLISLYFTCIWLVQVK